MDKERLTAEIRYEIAQLRRLADMAERLVTAIGGDPLPWHAAAGAKYVADFWLGCENLCKRRSRHLGLNWPVGADSHKRVLDEFLQHPALGALLPAAIQERLREYLKFRHRSIHGYGVDMEWEMVEEPLRLLPETVELLAELWLKWLETPC